MSTIELITFKGCQSTIDFRSKLERWIRQEAQDWEVRMRLVPSPEHAIEMGLHGAPTIIIDGREYQQDRRGPAEFY